MVYVTGDTHAEFGRFSSKPFPEQRLMTKDDFVIILGDFGGVWHDCPEERYWLDWLDKKPFTLLFIDGNHENMDRLYSEEFPIVDFHGGKAHKIRENIYHLMRGYVYQLCGKKFFTFGGAGSHDIQDGILEPDDYRDSGDLMKVYRKKTAMGKMIRINHVSWWKEEMPSKEEMDFGLKNLSKHGNKVDFILTHCCPQHIVSLISHGVYKPDVLTEYFNHISQTVCFGKWYFGHYHREEKILDNYILKYRHIERIV